MRSFLTPSVGMRESVRRGAVVALGTAAASLGIFAAPAQAASWESYLDSVGPNFESRRWYQGSAAAGTKIQFTGCTGGNVANVTLYKDIPYLPDPRYTMAAFTNCYNSSTAVSTGNWNDHGAADYYFVINEGAAEVYLSVRKVKVTY